MAKTTIIALTLVVASLTLFALPVYAQIGPHGYYNEREGGSSPLPAGVTANENYNTIAHLSFRPNPIGVGQPLLVNIWMQPPISALRYYKQAFQVVFTKPDGTTDTIGPLDSYQGDATAWFEYTVDQVGTWKVKFNFLGGYWPAGNYSVTAAYLFGSVINFPLSIYMKPSSDGPYDLVVQQNPALSWPGSPLPTDYWTRPVSPMNREWWPITGNYPATGIVGGGPSWPADTNRYMSNYGFTPYVQGPKTAHIVWKRQDAISGLVGGSMGLQSYTTAGSTPPLVYAGRAYQTFNRIVDGVVTSVWECYDLRTGQVYWDKINITQAPTMISYVPRNTPIVPGEVAGSEGFSVSLMYIGSGRLIKYDPYLGTTSLNISIAPLTTATFYGDPNFLGVYNAGTTANPNYRLINWTIIGDLSFPTLSNLRVGVMNNVSYPFSSIGTADYESMIAVNTVAVNSLAAGGVPLGIENVAYSQQIIATSLLTGQILWNVSTDPTTGLGGFFSGSTSVADHAKFAVRLNDGHWHCWDLYTGKELWTSELSSWPWGTFGCYGVQSYGGNIISNQYDGVVAYNWTNGKITWWYKSTAPFPYETPFQDYYPWFTGTARIADGVLYTYNTEHTPSQPLTRGLKLHAINITTGEGIWNITGSMAPGAVADGYLTAGNQYDGYMYVFGKGKSATTVTAQKTIVKGSSVLIEGTVLDQSPAQPGTPCVSPGSMATYMEYLHLQLPVDGVTHNITVTGVPMKLLAIDSNNNVIDIGTATSDVSGKFQHVWTPTTEGSYKITATFAGDDSYGSSWDETGLLVSPAPTTPTTPTTQVQAVPDYTWTIIGAAIAVIIAVAIATVLIIRKR